MTVKEREGPVLFCGKCGNELGEWDVGMLWHIRPGDGVADAPKGPSRGGNPRSTSRRGVAFFLGFDGHPHRFECKCGAVWHIHDDWLPLGPIGDEFELRMGSNGTEAIPRRSVRDATATRGDADSGSPGS